MSEEEVTDTKGKKKKSDYAEVEFEIGKGRDGRPQAVKVRLTQSK